MKKEEYVKEFWNSKEGKKWRFEFLEGTTSDDHTRMERMMIGFSKCKWEQLPEIVKKEVRDEFYRFTIHFVLEQKEIKNA